MQAVSPEMEQVTPLAAAAAASFRKNSCDEEDPSKWQQADPSCCKRRSFRCFICCAAVMVVIFLVLLVVALTVYKVRDPVMRLNSLAIKRIAIVPPNVSLTIVADVSVKNNNPATFYFDNSVTSLYYHSELMGKAVGPAGRAAGRRTYRMNVTLDLVSDKVLSNPALIQDVQSGILGVNSSTVVAGHVFVFGIFRHHVDVFMSCAVVVAVANQSILDQLCWQYVRV